MRTVEKFEKVLIAKFSAGGFGVIKLVFSEEAQFYIKTKSKQQK
jgi:hypothetical protein